jgi:membrane fusion protein (multidrug efflux system)
MKVSSILAIILALITLSLPACNTNQEEQSHQEQHKIVVTSPKAKDVTITQKYVCQIRSQCHIDVCALANGYLMEIPIKEGQVVQEGELMFQILPTLYKAKLDAEEAEVRLAQQEHDNTEKLVQDKNKIVAPTELLLYKAKLEKAKARRDVAKAELKFTKYTAPFSGIVDRLLKQQGSVISEKEVLTTLSDNSVVWVYFNVPEVRWVEYKAGQGIESQQIELVLANGSKFPQICESVTPMGTVNNETGNMPFRANFPNPNRLLRQGQTGNVLIHRKLKNAIVIPQRATFEILDKRYVFVVGKDDVVHQREIVVQNELENIFVIKSGLTEDDRIVLDGTRQIHEGQKLEHYEFRNPEQVLADQGNKAE